MNVLIFEWKNFGIEDICDAFKDMAIKYKCISTELMRERKNEEFDNIFENEMSIKYKDLGEGVPAQAGAD